MSLPEIYDPSEREMKQATDSWERWKASAAWLTKRWNCTSAFITSSNGCGSCCKGKIEGYWPPRSIYPGESEPRCHYFGRNGCTLSLRDKPVGCMLTPLTLNKSRTLVIMHRLQFRTSMCKGACGTGPMLIDALKPGLIELFGIEQWKRVRRDIMDGHDSFFYLPPQTRREFERELMAQAKGATPLPRSTPICETLAAHPFDESCRQRGA
jgi:hypothetical protein